MIDYTHPNRLPADYTRFITPPPVSLRKPVSLVKRPVR